MINISNNRSERESLFISFGGEFHLLKSYHVPLKPSMAVHRGRVKEEYLIYFTPSPRNIDWMSPVSGVYLIHPYHQSMKSEEIEGIMHEDYLRWKNE